MKKVFFILLVTLTPVASGKVNCTPPLIASGGNCCYPGGYCLSNSKWQNGTVSVSFMPDGTSMGSGYTSNLFATYDAAYPTAVWQREFARALQTWASVSGLNFYFVNDSGLPTGTSGLAQGDSRFGDIRLGANLINGSLAYTYSPSSSTFGGDIALNSNYTHHIGSYTDLYSLLLHETGHALGLAHSYLNQAVMYSTIMGVYSGLHLDDISGIQAIYGARTPDSYDLSYSNQSFYEASPLSARSGRVSVPADITAWGDIDYYRVEVPEGADGSLEVVTDTFQTSLLAPQVTLYSSNEVILGNVSVDYGQTATLTLNQVVPGETLYVRVWGNTTDPFGTGAYILRLAFGGNFPADAPEQLVISTVASTRLDLKWVDRSYNETGFQIERSMNGGSFSNVGTTMENGNTFSDPNLRKNTIYTYRLRAFNAVGYSPYSNTVTAKTLRR